MKSFLTKMKSALAGAVLAGAIAGMIAGSAMVPFAYAASNGIFDGYLSVIGKIWTGGVPPVLTACGTTPAVVGSDTAGLVTMGTGTPTGCVITFAVAYVTAPTCVVTWEATPLASQSYTISATAITTVQTATSSNKLHYDCKAQVGG